MPISSFLQEEKTKDFNKYSSGLIKPIMPAHFDGFDHSLAFEKCGKTRNNASSEGG